MPMHWKAILPWVRPIARMVGYAAQRPTTAPPGYLCAALLLVEEQVLRQEPDAGVIIHQDSAGVEEIHNPGDGLRP